MRKFIPLLLIVSSLFSCGNEEDTPYRDDITIYKGSLETIKGPRKEIDLILHFPKELYQIYTIHGYGSFYIDRRVDIIKNHLREGKIWEEQIAGLIQVHALPGSTVIDIGAHIGTHTIVMSKKIGNSGKVFAFEPQLKLFAELRLDPELNQCSNVFCYRCALGSSNQEIEMNPPVLDNEGGTSIGKGGNPAKMITLDSLNLHNVSLIKIDVENSEFDVLKGARNTILHNLPVMIIEIMGNTYDPLENRSGRIQEILTYIENLGYKLSYIEGSWSDWLAIPK